MGNFAIKKLEDIKKLKIGEILPVEDYVNPSHGLLELKGFGYILGDGAIISDKGTTYVARPIVKGIQIDKKEGYAEIQVEIRLGNDPLGEGRVGTLQCIIE